MKTQHKLYELIKKGNEYFITLNGDLLRIPRKIRLIKKLI
jgi:hypothetical protein